jgi:uroporphyrinogen decarboxylase
MGMPLELGDGGPVLSNPIRDAAAISKLRAFDPEQETRFLCDALRLLRRSLNPAVPVLGFAGAPWTLACYMVEGRSKDGFPAAKQFLYSDRGACRALLDTIAANTARYLQAQVAAGASAVQLFDTWAGELTLTDFRANALPATQRIIRELKSAYPNVPVILYSKNTSHLLNVLAETGADVLSFDWRIDLAAARRSLGPRIALQGNVDPCVLLGRPDGIRQAVAAAIEKTAGRGHVLNLGHGILPNTPVEHARLFIESAKSISLAAASQAVPQ